MPPVTRQMVSRPLESPRMLASEPSLCFVFSIAQVNDSGGGAGIQMLEESHGISPSPLPPLPHWKPPIPPAKKSLTRRELILSRGYEPEIGDVDEGVVERGEDASNYFPIVSLPFWANFAVAASSSLPSPASLAGRNLPPKTSSPSRI